MNSTPSHVAGLAYQVRATGTGRVLGQFDDQGDAYDEALVYTSEGGRPYVTFVELIDGVWTAPED